MADPRVCKPELVWKRRSGTAWYCPYCGFKDVDKAGHFEAGLIYPPRCKASNVPLWFPELGNLVARMLSLVGITKDRWSRFTGKPCRCDIRRLWLNQLGWSLGRPLFWLLGYRRTRQYHVREWTVENVDDPNDHGRLHRCCNR
jgi:hypothetical protein